jgi:hypothetical protein
MEATGMPHVISKRYLKKLTAWSDEPRAATVTTGGRRSPTRRPSSPNVFSSRASSRATASAASPVSVNISDGFPLMAASSNLTHAYVGGSSLCDQFDTNAPYPPAGQFARARCGARHERNLPRVRDGLLMSIASPCRLPYEPSLWAARFEEDRPWQRVPPRPARAPSGRLG